MFRLEPMPQDISYISKYSKIWNPQIPPKTLLVPSISDKGY